MLYPNEVIIHDDNADQFLDVEINGERKSRGLIPRDYSQYPLGYYKAAKPFYSVDVPLIDQSLWSELLKDKIANKSQISDIRMVGNGGQPIPALDQDGVGYCLPAGQTVRMADGTWKNIEQVKLEDVVISSDLKPRRVMQTHRRLYTGTMVGIVADGLERVYMTGDHIVPIHYNGWWKCVKASELNVSQQVLGLGETRVDTRNVCHLSFKDVKNVPVYDIGVEEDHYFFTGNGLLVHNCWAHSSTSANMMLRAVMNQPYVPLSAFAVAATIKHGADEGGWGAQSLDFIMEKGQPSQSIWPQGDRNYTKYQNDTKCWENAALHKVTAGFIDLQAQQYDRNLSFQQIASCLLSNIPVVTDFNWWSHSVCAIDLVDGNSMFGISARDPETGKLLHWTPFKRIWGADDPVTAGFGLRILNSWGDSWSDHGMGTLTGSKAQPNGAVAPYVTRPSVN